MAPRLGNAGVLNRRVPQPQTRPVRMRVQPAVDGMLRAVDTIQGAVDAKLEKRKKLNYARARLAFLKQQTLLSRELERETDWKNLDKLYDEGIRKARDEAAQLIEDDAAREAFSLDVGNDIERGRGVVFRMQRKGEVDDGLASLDQSADDALSAALDASTLDGRTAAMAGYSAALEAARSAGYINEQAMGAKMRGWSDQLAKGELMKMPPQAQIAALEAGEYDAVLNGAERAAYMKAAKTELRTLQNQARIDQERAERKANEAYASQMADKFVTSGMSRSEVMAQTKGMKVSHRSAILGYYDQVNATQDRDALQRSLEHIQGGGDIRDIPSSDVVRLQGAGKWNAVVKASEGIPIETPPKLFADIENGLESRDPEWLKKDLSLLAGEMADDDLKYFQKKQADARNPSTGKDDGLITPRDQLNNTLRMLKIDPKVDPEEYHKFIKQFRSMEAPLIKANGGKALDADQRQQVLDSMTVDVVIKDYGWPLGKTHRKAFLVDVEEVPDDIEAEIRRQWVIHGKEGFSDVLKRPIEDLSEDVILEFYLAVQAMKESESDGE